MFMQKIITLLLATTISITLPAQNRLFDQQMVIKQMNIRVNADCFTATTFIEMEFYNPKDKEIEGLYRFKLDKEQAITAFQLDLHGRYRDGSIEEKWKARAAYNSIVGKRIDPAIIQYEYNGNYRLNIYPVPAKSSRKITMTIQQLLKKDGDELIYYFPLNTNDRVENLSVEMNVNGCGSIPLKLKGLVEKDYFSWEGGMYKLAKNSKDITLPGSFGFSLLLSKGVSSCTKTVDGKTYYALRMHTGLPASQPFHPKNVLIYWDASGSATKRDVVKEISFLKQFINQHKVAEVSVIAFAGQTYARKKFNPQTSKDWMQYLHSFEYSGPTRYDHINLNDTTADMIFLFSDGISTLGRRPNGSLKRPLFAVNSSAANNIPLLQLLISNSGGKLIDLSKIPVTRAVTEASELKLNLLAVNSYDTSTTYNFIDPPQSGKIIELYGSYIKSNKLQLQYGNAALVKTIDIVLPDQTCNTTGVDRMSMLVKFNPEGVWNDWEETLEFGLKEKVVTSRTSYLVLERIEDYIRYNISPPKELEQECKDRGYVKQDTKTWRQQMKEKDEFDILDGVVQAYNHKLSSLNDYTSQLTLSRKDFENFRLHSYAGMTVDGASPGISNDGQFGSSALQEVVVTGYGMARQRSLTSSSLVIRGASLNSFGSIQQALEGRVAGLQVMRQHNRYNNEHASIILRRVSTLTGNSQPLYIVDGFAVEDNINSLVTIHDVENIVVLKGIDAAALYGSRAANGAIVITTRKYNPRYNYNYEQKKYKLKNMEDEDWVKEIRAVDRSEKIGKYRELKMQYGHLSLFYLEMAEELHRSGWKQYAMEVLFNSIETANGTGSAMKAVAYVLEGWKDYDKAAEIYTTLLQQNPVDLEIYRDLSWAYYQNGQVQKAVDILYSAIRLNLESSEYYSRGMKAQLLRDMNAMIAVSSEQLDLAKIPVQLIKPVSSDLRIIISGNHLNFSSEINEPGKNEKKKSSYGHYDRYYYYHPQNEYLFVDATRGKYKIDVQYHSAYDNDLPEIVRVVTFRNFGKNNQSIEIENVIMNNQRGTIEIGEIEWNE